MALIISAVIFIVTTGFFLFRSIHFLFSSLLLFFSLASGSAILKNVVTKEYFAYEDSVEISTKSLQGQISALFTLIVDTLANQPEKEATYSAKSPGELRRRGPDQ